MRGRRMLSIQEIVWGESEGDGEMEVRRRDEVHVIYIRQHKLTSGIRLGSVNSNFRSTVQASSWALPSLMQKRPLPNFQS